MSEIKIGDYADAPQYAPNDCTVIGIWEEKVWLLTPEGGTIVAPIDGIVLHRDKIKPKKDLTKEWLDAQKDAGGINELKDVVFALKTVRAREIKGKKCSQCRSHFGHCSMSQWSGRHGEYQEGEACMYFEEHQ